MRKVDEWFERYGESHQNPRNEAIHWLCVPLIVWSVLALLWSWTPIAAYLVILAGMGFYLWLSPSIALGMLAMIAVMVYTLTLPWSRSTLLIAAIAVFVLAWIGQFIGHRIKGRKPKFLEDLKFLLVGPAWVLSFLYRRLHLPY